MSRELGPVVEHAVGGRVGLVVGVAAGARSGITAFGRPGQEPPDEHTTFEIGSITKVFTGTLLAVLVGGGTVRLEDRASEYLASDLRIAGDPTLLELASHQTGLPNVVRGLALREHAFALGLPGARDPHADLTPERFRAALARTRTRRRRFRYSSLAFGLLGEALATAAGRPYGDLLRDRVLAPLGMNATVVGHPASGAVASGHSRRGRPRPPFYDPTLAAAGGLRSTAADMLRFAEANLDPTQTPLAGALELAQRTRSRPTSRLSVGLGWIIVRRRGETVHWHNGGTWGFRSFLGLARERGAAVVVLADEARSVDRIGFRLLHALPGRDAL